jgi:lipoprotein-anchoring transpeptidase ErfK/SrfK
MPFLINRRATLAWLAASAAFSAQAAKHSAQAAKNSEPIPPVAPAPASRSATEAEPIEPPIEPVNETGERPPLAQGAQGEAVLRAQILLDRACFSPGEIDASFSTNMRHIVAAFQRANELNPSGRIDEATWKALEGSEPAPVLGHYTITQKDAAGPFRKLPADMMARAQLDALGYASLDEALGEKFHCSPAWLREANPGNEFRAGDEIVVPALERDKALPAAASMLIQKSAFLLFLLDQSGWPVAAFPITLGTTLDPLPVGRMEITSVLKNPAYNFDPALLRGTKKSDVKAQIAPGPNNPVGVYWLGLSRPHLGIHGTPEPSRIGLAESNGCVRLTNWDVQLVAQLVEIGFPVEVRA